MRHIILIFFLIIFLLGCQNNIQPQKYSKPLSDDLLYKYSENEKAKDITKSITENSMIKNAVVVVSGNTALIGLNMNSDGNNINNIKEDIIQKVKMFDSSISNIEISTDKEMYNRINKLNQDIINDKPIKGIVEDFINLLKIK